MNSALCVVTPKRLLIACLALLVLTSAIVGGFCLSGKCSGGDDESSDVQLVPKGSQSADLQNPAPTTGPESGEASPESTAPLVSCASNDDCANGVCASESFARRGKVCCPSGDSEYLSYSFGYFCNGLPVGAQCGDNNVLCASGICVGGVCKEGKQPDGELCDDNSDCEGTCVSKVCAAFQDAGGSCDDEEDCLNRVCASESLAKRNSICCPSGSSEYLGYSIGRFCGGQPVGAQCRTSNALCSTGVCVGGLCKEGKQADGEACDSNSNCEGTCVQKVCVPFQDKGGTCDDKEDCLNGVCASESLAKQGNICCPSGGSEYLGYSVGTFCVGQPVGAQCRDSNNLCSSGVCVGGVCKEGKQADGANCDDNWDCEGTCVNKVCVPFQDKGASCDDKEDCLNRVCAAESLANRGSICCPSGGSENLGYSVGTYCSGQPVGAQCRTTSALCSSGVCSDGVCE